MKTPETLTRSPGEIEKINGLAGITQAQLAVMGNNDSEYRRVDDIYNSFMTGEIEIDEAERQMNEVVAGKIDR